MKANEGHKTDHYLRFGIEMALDFVVMYLVMYTMIANVRHFYLNINNVYMTLMMVSSMAIVMLVNMRSMFPSQRLNIVIFGVAALAFVVGFAGTRTQAAVGDVEFLRSMIPHHSGAILMCEKASITDPEIVALCRQIISSQQTEISQMQTILDRY